MPRAVAVLFLAVESSTGIITSGTKAVGSSFALKKYQSMRFNKRSLAKLRLLNYNSKYGF